MSSIHARLALLLLAIACTKPMQPVEGTLLYLRNAQSIYLDWSLSKAALPKHLSELSATYTIAPDDDGDINVLIYIVGGCEDLTRYASTDNSPDGFARCEHVSDMVYAYDPVKDLIAKRKRLPQGRYGHGAQVVNGIIWVVGGRDGEGNIVRDVDIYRPAHDRWTRVGQLPEDLAVYDALVVARGNDLYVIGGYNVSGAAVATTFMISADTEDIGDLKISWRTPMHQARGQIEHGVVYGKYVFVGGGYGTDSCDLLASTERYNILSDEWVATSNMNKGRAASGFVKYEGNIIALGGEFKTSQCGEPSVFAPVTEVERYDPLQGKDSLWEVIDVTPLDERIRFAAVPWTATDSIYVFGGMSPGSNGCNCYESLNSVLVYRHSEKTDTPKMHITWIIVSACIALTAIILACTRMRTKRAEARNSEDEHEGIIKHEGAEANTLT